MPLNLAVVPMRSISEASWLTSVSIAALSSALERAVLVLHGQLTDALEHRVNLGQRTFRRLDERDAVLRVALSLGQAADLTAHLLADRETGGVVGGTVDAVTATTALHRLGGLARVCPGCGAR